MAENGRTDEPALRPEILQLDDPAIVGEVHEEAPPPGRTAALPAEPPGRVRRWARRLVLGGAAGLVLAMLLDQTVHWGVTWFAEETALSWLKLGLLAAVAAGLLVLAALELRSYLRLASIEALRGEALAVLQTLEPEPARRLVDRLMRLHRHRPEARWGLARFAEQHAGLDDPQELLALYEIAVLGALDERCRAEIAKTARRTVLITAITPFPLLDFALTLRLNIGMIRRIAEIHGGRPGALATVRLLRGVAVNVLVATGIETADDMFGDLIGGGLLRKLSTRAGEGMLNGTLTIRLGITAMLVCRPLPYAHLKPPSVLAVWRHVAAELRPGGRPL